MPQAKAISRNKSILFFIVISYFLLYSLLCGLRFTTFHALIDMSYYLRLCWGLAHNYYDLPLVQSPHVLGLHLEPILLPLALLNWLGVPLVPLLLGVQAAAVALLAWPAYRLAQRRLGDAAALPAALLALLYPTVTVATLHDFHPVTLALPLLLAMLDALDAGQPRRAFLWAALALCCREDIALQLALTTAGVLLFGGRQEKTANTHSKKTKIALLLLIVFLVLYFLIYIVIIQPRYLPKFGSYGLHFANTGGQPIRSGKDMILALLRNPQLLLGLLFSGDRLGYVWQLLWPVALLPLLAPQVLLGALPVLAINFLSSFPRVRSIESHYTTALVPFLIAASILGAARLKQWLSVRGQHVAARQLRWISVGALLPVTLAHILHGGSPLALRSERFVWSHFRDGADAATLRAAIASVPPLASVAARPGALAHLAQRPRTQSPPEYDDGLPVDVVLTPDAQPADPALRRPRIGNTPVQQH